jgi:hypothetical protein
MRILIVIRRAAPMALLLTLGAGASTEEVWRWQGECRPPRATIGLPSPEPDGAAPVSDYLGIDAVSAPSAAG